MGAVLDENTYPTGVLVTDEQLESLVSSLAYFSSLVAPVLVGRLRDVTGSYVPGLLLFAALAGSLAPAGLLLPETGPGRKGQASC